MNSLLWLSNIPWCVCTTTSYPSICWWTSRLLPCPGYCKSGAWVFPPSYSDCLFSFKLRASLFAGWWVTFSLSLDIWDPVLWDSGSCLVFCCSRALDIALPGKRSPAHYCQVWFKSSFPTSSWYLEWDASCYCWLGQEFKVIPQPSGFILAERVTSVSRNCTFSCPPKTLWWDNSLPLITTFC